MYQIARKLKDFSAAHRLIHGYKGKCQHLHGHNYQVTVTLASESLDSFGFVEDFNRVKQVCDEWVQTHWDHTTLVHAEDHVLREFLEANAMRHYVIHDYPNTTAEALAAYLFKKFDALLSTANIKLCSVEVSETEFCKACYVSKEGF